MNRLSPEPSSYLRSASGQPVNWFPWSDEAFQKAKEEDKPVLVSVGAVWCHWCHVMARESFEDRGIADFINNNFIAVKIDRDERPDLDKHLQNFVQSLTGVGGWPLTVFMTSEKEPFYGGTYFPPADKHGLPGFMSVLQKVLGTYKTNKERLSEITQEIKTVIDQKNKTEKSRILDFSAYQKALDNIFLQADKINGGFIGSPKFFMAEALLLFLDSIRKDGGAEKAKWVETTLKSIRSGGVWDQLGGGFHRYATDDSWTTPHFEKLLTDNAMMARVYLKAYQIFRREEDRQTAMETLEFILRELSDSSGLFYASQDADIDHEEGAYFTWTKKELEELLDERAAKILSIHFGVLESGNSDVRGKNVLSVRYDIEEIAEVLKADVVEIKKIIDYSKKILLLAREKRPRPFIDKNSFTSWNSLAASAFIQGYRIAGDKKYLDAATRCIDVVLDRLYRGGVLYHMFSPKTNRAYVTGFLDDYAFLCRACLDMYQTVFDQKYLKTADELAKKMITNFWDSREEGFTYSAKHKKETYEEKPFLDFSLPAGNPAAAEVLLDLWRLTDERKFFGKAESIFRLFFSSPPSFDIHKATYLQALDSYFRPPPEFFIAGGFSDAVVKEFVRKINFELPRKTVYLEIKNPKLADKKPIGGKSAVYVCHNNSCSLPITTMEQLEKELEMLKPCNSKFL